MLSEDSIIKEIYPKILSITRDKIFLRVEDLIIAFVRTDDNIKITVWSAKTVSMIGNPIILTEEDIRKNSYNIDVGEPHVNFLLKQLVDLIKRWNELKEIEELKEIIDLYAKTPYQGTPPRKTPADELVSALIEILKRQRIIKSFRQGDNIIGIFCYDSGVWRPCETDLEAEIARIGRETPLIGKKISKSLVDRVLYNIKASTMEKIGFDYSYIAFENKIFCWRDFLETGSISEAVEDPDPNKFVFHKIPHKINLDLWKKTRQDLRRWLPPKDCSDLIEILNRLAPTTYNYMKDLVIGMSTEDLVKDRICFLMQFIGRIMLPGYRINGSVLDVLKNIFIFLGEPNTGKTTFVTNYVGSVILGEENFKVTDLSRLTSINSEDVLRELGDLYNVLMAVHPDIDKRHQIKKWGVIRMISGGEPVKGRRLRENAFDYYPAYKLVLTSNDPPELNVEGVAKEAVLERIKALEFYNDFTGKKLDISALAEEADAAIIAYLFATYLTYRYGWANTGINNAEDLLLRYTEPVYLLLSRLIEKGLLKKDPNGRIRIDELYEFIQSYMKTDEDLSRLFLPVQSAFTRRLKRYASKFGFTVRSGHSRYYYLEGASLNKETRR